MGRARFSNLVSERQHCGRERGLFLPQALGVRLPLAICCAMLILSTSSIYVLSVVLLFRKFENPRLPRQQLYFTDPKQYASVSLK